MLEPTKSHTYRWQATNIALLLFIGFLWGSAFGAMKIAVAETGPVTLAAMRASIAAVVLLAILRVRQPIPWHLLKTYLPQFFVIGGLGTALPFILIPWAELRIESSTAGLLMSVGPLATMAGAFAFRLETSITPKRIFGITIGLIGTIVIFWGGLAEIGQGYVIAQFATVMASLCYVAGNLMVRKLTHIPPLTISALAIFLAALCLWPVAVLLEAPQPQSWSVLSWQLIIWLGIMPTALAFTIRYMLIARAGASFTSYVGYLIPAIAMIIGAVALAEPITFDKFMALLLILTGLLFAQQDTSGQQKQPK